MSFNVIATLPFERKLKKLAKKHKSIRDDLLSVIDLLEQNPTMGTSLGKNCFKIRFVLSGKAKGKRGGARIITFVRSLKNTVYLVDIYDKSEQNSISDRELKNLIELISDNE